MENFCTAGQSTHDNIIQRMRTACWITKAKNTHSEFVILIAFARQELLREGACPSATLDYYNLSHQMHVLHFLAQIVVTEF